MFPARGGRGAEVNGLLPGRGPPGRGPGVAPAVGLAGAAGVSLTGASDVGGCAGASLALD